MSMENLPEALITDIIKRLTTSSDRNSLSLVSKQLYKIEAHQRRSIRVACGFYLLTKSLTSLCIRFPNLTKIEITYYHCIPYPREQLDDRGLFILSTNCPSLTDLTLSYCSFITDSGLCYLAACKKLVDLSIVECGAIHENSLVKLGNCLRKLERLVFKMDLYDQRQPPRTHNLLAEESWFMQQLCCERLKELSFINCVFRPEGGSYLILGCCSSLEKVCLKGCIGLDDSDIIFLSKKSRGLKSISLKIYLTMTDASLNALGSNCPFLESVELDFKYQRMNISFMTGILTLISGCSIRVLVIKDAIFLNASAMESLSLASSCLETLEIERAHKITNFGIGFVINFPCLANLKITGCKGISDYGLNPLIKSQKLNYLMIKSCPYISEQAAQGAARHVCYEKYNGDCFFE